MNPASVIATRNDGRSRLHMRSVRHMPTSSPETPWLPTSCKRPSFVLRFAAYRKAKGRLSHRKTPSLRFIRSSGV